MKYSEAEKLIKALSSKYSIDVDSFNGCLNINYKGIEIAFINNDTRYNVNVWSSEGFSKLPFSNNLYMILAELAMTPLDERAEETKQYVKVFDNEFGYLNIDDSNGDMVISGMPESYGYKTKFTDKDIEELKQRDDIPLDWDKVRFVEAK
ncbi:hypothetical protein [Lactiplantibacillus plantarum]|uniref:hypothetical protein n=1 Tax=Lactiplantibacillus plantarum TaxID=1590 RepID=UPI000D0C1A6B|nr:hypothetical protein [Lactiplantibacillus plantarum]SPD90199.1 hypothetical protein LAP8962_00700 [Lactiplantibacillus plantarum]VFI61225.1 hypothetical protein LAP9434_00698 [Lactiplantibacillus plantarum]VFQ55776.1 hypothetical protein LAP9435_0698 [Lactiplantibacillus plantarum]